MEFTQSIAPVKREVNFEIGRVTPGKVFEVENTMTQWNNLFVYGFVSKVEFDLMRAWIMYKAFNGGSYGK